MRFASLAFKNVFRRRFRSLLTLAGLGLAIGALTSLVGISTGFERSFNELYESRQIDLVVVRAGSVNRTAGGIDLSYRPKIAAIPGIKDVTGGTVDVVSFEDKQMFGVLMNGWPADSFLFDEIEIQGRRPRAGERRTLILGQTLAANLEKKVGDRLQLFDGEDFEVVGIFRSDSIYENGAIVTLLDELQRLMNRPSQVTAFIVRLEPPVQPEQVAEVCRQVKALDPMLDALATRDFISGTTEIRIAKAMAWVTSLVALVVGTVGMLNTMVMSVFERTREIGILRAIGWRTERVVRLILYESCFLSVVGALGGILGALLLVQYFSTLPFLAGFVDGRIPVPVLLQGLAVGVLSGLLGAILPAWHAASLPPTTAFRQD